MSRVVIDTNILYSLVGLSLNPKVTSSNIKSFKLSITTSSLIEAIVKHHNDLRSIKVCIEPIIKNEIEIINIGHTPISNSNLISLYLATDLDDNVRYIINGIRTLKISREAEFYRFILIIVISGLFEIIRENGYKFDNESQNQTQLKLVKSLFESNIGPSLDYLKQEIYKGYVNGNEQQAALETFQAMINGLLRIFHFNYHMIKTNCLSKNLSIDEIKVLSKSLNDDNFNKKFKKYIDNPISYVSRKKHYLEIDRYLSIIKNGLLNSDSFTDESLQFLLGKIENAYKHKSKIRKNDIFDFFIVISLKLDGTKIVTLDKDFLKDLKEIHEDSYELCQELGYVG